MIAAVLALLAGAGVERTVPAAIRAAAKQYADGPHTLTQYAHRGLEMCLGAEAWQRSRIAELQKLLDLGFRVIALDEFPTSPSWGAEACRAKNHLHRPNDFADEMRVTRELVHRLSTMAHARGVPLSSEEPSVMLLSFTSGYMDGTFNAPPDMYELWGGPSVERIPLFSTMFGAQLTPYTRIGGEPKPPGGWMLQEKVTGP